MGTQRLQASAQIPSVLQLPPSAAVEENLGVGCASVPPSKVNAGQRSHPCIIRCGGLKFCFSFGCHGYVMSQSFSGLDVHSALFCGSLAGTHSQYSENSYADKCHKSSCCGLCPYACAGSISQSCLCPAAPFRVNTCFFPAVHSSISLHAAFTACKNARPGKLQKPAVLIRSAATTEVHGSQTAVMKSAHQQ